MAGTNNTPFSPNSDLVAQLTGSGQAIPGNPAPTYVASGNTDITSVLQYTRFVPITTATGNSTVLTSFVAKAGAPLNIQINNDASNPRTITFGTGFRSTGVVTGTNSKAILVAFVSDGTTWNEVGRTSAALT